MISDSVQDRLNLIFEWYKGMVSEQTGRLLYLYDPEANAVVADGSPIRDIASIWDMEIVSDFLNREDLESVIDRSLEYFSHYLKERSGYLILDTEFLGEPSSIAHSAFLHLSLMHSHRPDRKEKARLLADGIVAQQRQDGSYKIFFGPEPDDGLAFYPGEAMLALLENYKMTNDTKYLQSAKRGFVFYRDHFYRSN